MIVLDAPVLIKWFIKESDSQRALQFKEGLLRGKFDIVLPDLALYEVLNVLRFKAGVTEEALHLSFATELSIYDCTYLALANELGARFVTADKRIVPQAEPLCQIKLLT